MKLSQKTCDTLTLLAFLILTAVIICLCLAISQAWKNERYLDAELNKVTTYGRTNK